MANFKKLAKLFCGEVATKATIEDCAEDFEWLADCGYDNAYFGYGIGAILSNKTAEDWIEYYGEEVKPVILAMARIGWTKCADSREVCKAVDKAIVAINEYRRISGYLY